MIKGFRVDPFTLDYTRDFVGGVEHYRPRIPVRMQNGEYQFRTAMVVDSGADRSLIPFEIADYLHLELGEPVTNIGPTGKFSVRQSEVELWIYPDRNGIPLGTIPVAVPQVSNVEDAADLVELCLLGRDPFFELFDVTYQQSKKKVVFRPSSKPAPKFTPPKKKSQRS